MPLISFISCRYKFRIVIYMLFYARTNSGKDQLHTAAGPAGRMETGTGHTRGFASVHCEGLWGNPASCPKGGQSQEPVGSPPGAPSPADLPLHESWCPRGPKARLRRRPERCPACGPPSRLPWAPLPRVLSGRALHRARLPGPGAEQVPWSRGLSPLT